MAYTDPPYIRENEPDTCALHQFDYIAFISYSQIDARAAKDLHSFIESYAVPKDLVGRPGRDGPIPLKIFPVFRDRDELPSSSNLTQTLHQVIERSAYLIVLCSPASAKSKWVNKEIVEFKRLGRSDRVHAIILRGEPNAAQGEQECYSPALRFELDQDGELDRNRAAEPLAADMRPLADGPANARLKIIAGLLGISFNDLLHRERIAAKRRAQKAAMFVGIFCVLAVLASIAAWQAYRYRQQSDDREVPGIRVERRDTVLDLSEWTATSPQDKSTKKSKAVSRNVFTVTRTHDYATSFLHVAGTSSEITPEVRCVGCTLRAKRASTSNRAPNEWKIEFDISRKELDEPFEISFDFIFWNAFQGGKQLWGGFRILHQTNVAKYTIVFPDSKKPLLETIRFYYVDSKEHDFVDAKQVELEKDSAGRIKRLTWEVPFPSADRSYRVSWDWNK